jgi:protein MpaA
VTRQSLITKIKESLSKISRKGWVIGGGVFGLFAIVSLYSVLFFVPKPIEFSYAQETCVGRWVVAPDLQQVSSDDFAVEFKDTLHLGNISLLSTRLCVTPTHIPQKGTYTAGVSPFGGIIARTQLSIEVPETPTAKVSDVVGKTISTAKPLTISLSSVDVVHQYNLTIADKKAECRQADATLSCDIAALDLAHGASYTAALYQSYKTSSAKVLEGEIATLQPLVLSASSVSEGQTIYDAPTSFSLTFDQPVKEISASLVKLTGDTVQKVQLTPTLSGAQASLEFTKLDRESTYRLDIAEAIAENGSSLADPIATIFKTSGGPKVSAVSVGATGVARNAAIAVTFDQPLDASIDIAQFAHLEGVEGTIRKKSDTQVTFAIQGGDCTPFKLILDKGLKSGSNGEVSKEAWSFSSQTICGYSWVIGSSVKGRAITAYSFGSGAKTILFTGGIHGSEPSGYTTMQALVQYLQANGNTIPGDTRVVVVPNTNPDGIAAGSRNNSRNVNVDRNFPTANWSASIETASGTLPTGGGTSPGSEPEAAALIALVRQLKPRLSVSYHAQGRLVGANKFADSVTIGDVYSSTVGYKTMYYNAEAVMGYPMTGEFEDWMGEEMNIPAILIELPTASGNYLNAQLPAIKKMFTL